MRRSARHIKSVILAAAVTVAVTACDSGTPSDSAALTDIVVLKSTGENGSVFELQLPGSDETVTLTSTMPLDTARVKPDRCIYLRYTPSSGRPYTSGPVEVAAYAAITNIEATDLTPGEADGWNATPVYMISCRPMLGRIIVYAGLAYPVEKRRLTVAVNSESVSARHAAAWLVHDAETGPETYVSNFYVAFDLRKQIEKYDISRLTLEVANSNLKENKINLNFKSNQ